jgi:glycosyltransferase involved in cell wall biosynthesis
MVGGGWVSSLVFHLRRNSNVKIGICLLSEHVTTLTRDNDGEISYYVLPAYRTAFDKVKRNLRLTDYLFEDRTRCFVDVICEFKPDVIHVFGTETPFALLAQEVDTPVIVHLQGLLNPYLRKWFPAGYGPLNLVKATPLPRLTMLSGSFGDYLRYKNMAVREEKIFSIVKFFNGRTNWDRRIVELMSESAHYYHVEEILRDSFYKRQWVLTGNNEIANIITVINPNIYKGIETILETANVLKSFSKRKFKWTVAGVPANNSLVRMFIKKTGLNPAKLDVIFSGPLKEPDLLQAMLTSDLFVHPSHIDNSPNSLCEAMILGMPIISTAVGGIQSILQNEKEGILIQDGEPFSMASAINEMLTKPALGTQMGIAARERAIKRHNPHTIVEATVAMYTSVIEKHKVNCE